MSLLVHMSILPNKQTINHRNTELVDYIFTGIDFDKLNLNHKNKRGLFSKTEIVYLNESFFNLQLSGIYWLFTPNLSNNVMCEKNKQYTTQE